MPVRIFITSGTTADCKQAVALIDGISAQFLLADRGYDTNEIVEKAVKDGIEVVIPPKRNRIVQHTPLGGECFPVSQALARNRYKIRQNNGLFHCCCSNSMH